MKRIWKCVVRINGFKIPVLVKGTYDQMIDFITDEFGENTLMVYGPITEKEETAATVLGLDVYLASD